MTKQRKKRKSPLYTGKEVYLGKMTIEEAFQKALEPYFNKDTNLTLNRKIS